MSKFRLFNSVEGEALLRGVAFDKQGLMGSPLSGVEFEGVMTAMEWLESNPRINQEAGVETVMGITFDCSNGRSFYLERVVDQ